MTDTLVCEIVTPVKTVFTSEATYVALPGEMGSFGVMKRHEPLVSALSSGVVRITTPEGGNRKVRFLVRGGYTEIKDNKVIVLANDAVDVDGIDPAAVRAEIAKAEQAIDSLPAGDAAAAFYKDQRAWLNLQLHTVTESE